MFRSPAFTRINLFFRNLNLQKFTQTLPNTLFTIISCRHLIKWTHNKHCKSSTKIEHKNTALLIFFNQTPCNKWSTTSEKWTDPSNKNFNSTAGSQKRTSKRSKTTSLLPSQKCSKRWGTISFLLSKPTRTSTRKLWPSKDVWILTRINFSLFSRPLTTRVNFNSSLNRLINSRRKISYLSKKTQALRKGFSRKSKRTCSSNKSANDLKNSVSTPITRRVWPLQSNHKLTTRALHKNRLATWTKPSKKPTQTPGNGQVWANKPNKKRELKLSSYSNKRKTYLWT